MSDPAGLQTGTGSNATSRAAAVEEHPILVVVCDVEEEFDWSAPFHRSNTSVGAMSKISRLQELAEEFELRPTYVIDYPVASQPEGYGPLQPLRDSGNCEIGAHLHPWVTPPFEEEVTRYNSFAGNLPLELERAKLRELTRSIRVNLGIDPAVYKAGRYGIGASSYRILEEEGFETDLSPMPPFDFSEEGGPDFSEVSLEPELFQGVYRLLRLPQTGAYVGLGRGLGNPLYRLAESRMMSKLRLPGILARLRVIDRLVLTPEGYSFEELVRLTRDLLGQGIEVFCFSFHSPSLVPGCTPYVRNDSDLERFLKTCYDYFEFFRSEIGGIGMTASEVRTSILNRMDERQA